MKQIIKKLISSVLVVSLLAGIMIVSTAAPATPVDAGNLLKASNFYEGNDAWSISPNCQIDGGAYRETYVEEEIPTIGKTRALQITQRAGDTQTNPAVVIQYVRLTQGNTYKLSYWLKVEGEGSELKTYYNPVGAGANRTVIESGITTTNGEWKKFEYTFNVEYATDAANEEYIRFEMADTTGESDVVFQLTDVQLEKTTKNYVPSTPSSRWSRYAPSGDSVSMANHEIEVITSGNASGNTQVSFTHDLEAGVTYILSFHLEIEGDVSQTNKINGYNFNIYELYGTPNNFTGINSTDEQTDYQKEWTVTSYTEGKTPTIRMYFARPSTADTTIKYTVTDLTITKKDDIVEDTEKITELVTTQPDAVTTSGPVEPANLFTNGSFTLDTSKVTYGTADFAMKTGFSDQNFSWGIGDTKAKDRYTWVVEENGAGTHGNAFKITGVGNNTTTSLVHTINWEAGKTYTVSYWLKTGSTGTPMLNLFLGGTLQRTVVGGTSGQISGVVSDWTQYVFEYTATEDAATNRKNLTFSITLDDSTETLYLADVQVKQATPDEPDAGVIDIAHNGAVNTEYTISFKVDIDGEAETYTDWNDGAFFSETNRGVLYQTGFADDAILATFDATAEGETFSYTYTPSEVDTTAATSAFSLYLAPTTGGELTYAISDFSITYRDETVIKEIVVNDADITSANPGAVTDTWGTNANELAYTMIQRWERVNKGIFATTDTDINTALTLGNFTEFESGADYRYSLVVMPNDGYYFSKDISLKLGETDVEATYYYCADGSLIIYPTDSEVFFTVLGDANKDGSADVRDLVRMKKKQASPSDTSIIVYLKKCKFETTTPNSILDADIKGLRDLLATQ